MKRLICLVIVFYIAVGTTYVCADDTAATSESSDNSYGFLLDDCIDFSVAVSHSDGIYTDVTVEEDRYAFDDFTMFMRKEATAEWLEYAVPDNQYLIFHTYFKENETISHFSFSWSADGEIWEDFEPIVEIKQVESWRWHPVIYNLKKLDSSAKYVRITFGNIDGTVWSPRIAGVYSRYKYEIETGFIDCINTEYYESTKLLKNLGFISGKNDYEFEPEKNITRAEFTKLIIALINLSGSADAKENIFADIASDYWAADAINTLYGIGIIHGDENNCFNPEDTVIASEAVKILIYALGYSVVAEEKGGYPTGFWVLANQLGLLNNINLNIESELNRGVASELISNALDVEMLYQVGFGADNRYNRDSITILNYFHNIYKINGILSDVGAMSIISGHLFSDKTAIIDDLKLTIGSYPLKDLLGQMVTAYVKVTTGSENGEILYASATAGTQINDIPYTCYEGVKDGYIYFSDDTDKENKIAFSNNTRVIYNGRYETRMGMINEPEFSCGFMKIIKYPGSATADVIIIEDYETYQMAAGGYLDSILTDKKQGSVNLMIDNAEMIEVVRYGEIIEYKEDIYISEDDIVNIAKSKDGNIIKVYISNEQIEGTLNSYNLDKNTCIIKNKEFYFSKDISKNNIESLTGNEVVGYFDINGAVAVLESSGLHEKYGYIQALSSSDYFSGVVKMRIITQNGAIEEYTADSDTKLNGIKAGFSALSVISPQLVRYTARENKSLISIELAQDSSSIGQENFTKNFSSESCKYYGGQLRLFASIYQIDGNTKIFLIPKDRNDITGYKVRDINYLITDKSYCVSLFDTDDTYMVNAAVIYLDKSDVRILEYADPVAIVEDCANILDKEGRLCIDVYAKVNGQDTHIYFDNEGGVDLTGSWLPEHKNINTVNGIIQFRKGDVFQYYMDDESHCKYFRMLLTGNVIYNNIQYERNFGDYGSLTEQNYFSELYSIFGTVRNKFSDKILVSAGANGTLRTFPLADSMIYILDTERNRLYMGDPSDISINDRVFIRVNFSSVREIIAIK